MPLWGDIRAAFDCGHTDLIEYVVDGIIKRGTALLSATFMPPRKEPRTYDEMMDYLETY